MVWIKLFDRKKWHLADGLFRKWSSWVVLGRLVQLLPIHAPFTIVTRSYYCYCHYHVVLIYGDDIGAKEHGAIPEKQHSCPGGGVHKAEQDKWADIPDPQNCLFWSQYGLTPQGMNVIRHCLLTLKRFWWQRSWFFGDHLSYLVSFRTSHTRSPTVSRARHVYSLLMIIPLPATHIRRGEQSTGTLLPLRICC